MLHAARRNERFFTNEAFLQLRVAVRVLGVALILNIARFHSHNFFLFCEASAARHLRLKL